MKKTLIIAVALIAFNAFQTPNPVQAQVKGKGHELSAAIQGLGIGSMPFRGSAKWNDQPGLALGFNVGYTYWFGKTFGFRTGVRLSRFSHNQKITNFDLPINTDLPLSSINPAYGSGLTTVHLRATATSIQEEQNYTYLELPLLFAMRFNEVFVNVGVSLAKAVNATADYSFTDPALTITGIPSLGVTPNPPVPMTMSGETEGSVKNVDMTKPFYFLLDGEVGYNIPLGDASKLALGLYGRWAPIAHKTDNSVNIYNLQSDATYSLTQPSTSAQVEKMGYYEVGVSLGMNLGLGRKHREGTDEQPVDMTSGNTNCEQIAAELEAMKAAREKNEDDMAALRNALQRAEADIAAIKAAQKKAEDELAAIKADKGEAATQAAQSNQQTSLREKAQMKLDALKATIYFDFKSSNVKPSPEEEEAIQAICEAMKAESEMQAIITGHTDSLGSEKVNMEYGYRRAKALKRYMVNQGVLARNIKCESKGETEPVGDNNTEEGRALNRRATVELK